MNSDLLQLTNNINEAVSQADILVFVIPSAFLESELQQLSLPLQGKTVFSAIKGIVPETGLIVGEHLHIKYDIPFDHIGVITGANFQMHYNEHFVINLLIVTVL